MECHMGTMCVDIVRKKKNNYSYQRGYMQEQGEQSKAARTTNSTVEAKVKIKFKFIKQKQW